MLPSLRNSRLKEAGFELPSFFTIICDATGEEPEKKGGSQSAHAVPEGTQWRPDRRQLWGLNRLNFVKPGAA